MVDPINLLADSPSYFFNLSAARIRINLRTTANYEYHESSADYSGTIEGGKKSIPTINLREVRNRIF